MTVDTAGVTFTCTATSAGGTSEASVTIKRDATPPVIVDASRTPGPNAHGWNNSDVTATFSATDAMSGIDGDATVMQVLSGEGAGQTASHTFMDLAGNAAIAVVENVNIDKTAPAMMCSITPSTIWPANGRLVPVTASITASDGLSEFGSFVLTSAVSDEGEGIEGFDAGTPDMSGQVRARRNGNGDGRTYSFTYKGTDVAGNSAQCVVTVTVPHDQRGR